MTEPLDLPPPPDGSPCGPNLEADLEDQSFGELERSAKPRAESQFGDTVEPGQAPDWPDVAAQAIALLGRTRDLRVMVLLAIARVNQNDMPGFAAALATIRWHIETQWEHVHPQLDPEDDNDPMLRSNCLMLLQEMARVIRPIREMPLAQMPRKPAGTGRQTTSRPVTWRDLAILAGQQEPEAGRDRIDAADMRAIFAETDPGRLAALREGLAGAEAELVAIPARFQAAAGSMGPDFKDLLRLIRDIQRDVARFVAEAADEAPAETPEPADEDAPADTGASPAPRTVRAVATIRSIGALTTRDDALLALELAAAYFRDREPSSPIPLLIDRARRLAPLPFLEIVRDLAPDGLMQAQVIAGTGSE